MAAGRGLGSIRWLSSAAKDVLDGLPDLYGQNIAVSLIIVLYWTNTNSG